MEIIFLVALVLIFGSYAIGLDPIIGVPVIILGLFVGSALLSLVWFGITTLYRKIKLQWK